MSPKFSTLIIYRSEIEKYTQKYRRVSNYDNEVTENDCNLPIEHPRVVRVGEMVRKISYRSVERW